MKTYRLFLVLFALAGATLMHAQEKQPHAEKANAPQLPSTEQKSAPQLSSTEKVAIAALGEKLQANQQKQQDLLKERDALVSSVHEVEADIAKEHPGFHFDESTGAIVKDAAKVSAETKK